MGKETGISWTHHTFNPWRGCTKVSAGCTHCYAETLSKRNPGVLGVWGKHGERVIAAESYWRQPLAWNRDAQAAGERRRVFCASLADVFEGQESMPEASWPLVQAARARLWNVIEATPQLDWLLLTKRPENIGNYTPIHWWHMLPPNVWIGTSVENQSTANERIPHLLNVPARVRFLSCEPLLGPVDVSRIPVDGGYVDALRGARPAYGAIDWVIAGGESGTGARPMHPDWARSLRDQCQAAGVPFHFKQHGEWSAYERGENYQWFGQDGKQMDQDTLFNSPIPGRVKMRHTRLAFYRVGKHAAGRLLDGRTWDDFPQEGG